MAKSNDRKAMKLIFLTLSGLSLFSACVDMANMRKLNSVNNKSTGGNGTAGTDMDPFTITSAILDTSTVATNRVVNVQGDLTQAAAKFLSICGLNATKCYCQFYTSASDISPVSSSLVVLSDTNNSLACTISGAVAATNYKYVMVALNDGTKKSSGLIPIKPSASLDDILANLDKQKVRGVYQYACTRTFFEGDGVTSNQITCTPNQRFGLITAEYNFYLYKSQLDTNFTNKPDRVGFSTAICGYTNAYKFSCGYSTPDLRYGLYKEAAGPFTVAVSMTSKPDGGAAGSEIFGYAALPDSNGNCAAGLVKIRPYIAQPPSVIANSESDQNCLVAGTIDNPPSNFINDGSLNNVVVEAATPTNFVVNRQPNTNCTYPTGVCVPSPAPAGTTAGDCTLAKLSGSHVYMNTTVSYSQLTPIVCAIPKNLVSTLGL